MAKVLDRGEIEKFVGELKKGDIIEWTVKGETLESGESIWVYWGVVRKYLKEKGVLFVIVIAMLQQERNWVRVLRRPLPHTIQLRYVRYITKAEKLPPEVLEGALLKRHV